MEGNQNLAEGNQNTSMRFFQGLTLKNDQMKDSGDDACGAGLDQNRQGRRSASFALS
jgi:hypothetical protein